MEPFLGKWKLDRDFDENVDEYSEAEGVPVMMRKSFGKMEVNMIMEKADEEGKFNCKIKLGRVILIQDLSASVTENPSNSGIYHP